MFRFKRRRGEPGAPGVEPHVPSDAEKQRGASAPAPAADARADEAIRAVAEFEAMSVATEPELLDALMRIRRGEDQGPVIWERKAGLSKFLDSAFPRCPRATLVAQVFTREPEGRGAHFDVYDSFLDPGYPWVEVFNLAGDAIVSVFPLPDQLSRRYALELPRVTDEAYRQRRRLADQALADSKIRTDRGLLLAGYGLIIPQQVAGPEWVHNVVPVNRETPGRFVKIAAVAQGSSMELYERGYTQIDGLLENALLHVPTEGSVDSENSRRRRCNVD